MQVRIETLPQRSVRVCRHGATWEHSQWWQSRCASFRVIQLKALDWCGRYVKVWSIFGWKFVPKMCAQKGSPSDRSTTMCLRSNSMWRRAVPTNMCAPQQQNNSSHAASTSTSNILNALYASHQKSRRHVNTYWCRRVGRPTHLRKVNNTNTMRDQDNTSGRINPPYTT